VLLLIQLHAPVVAVHGTAFTLLLLLLLLLLVCDIGASTLHFCTPVVAVQASGLVKGAVLWLLAGHIVWPCARCSTTVRVQETAGAQQRNNQTSVVVVSVAACAAVLCTWLKHCTFKNQMATCA
jgi:hypothetical protein